MKVLIIAAVAATAIAGYVGLPRVLDGMGLRRKNFRGDLIPVAYGAQVAFFALLGLIVVGVLKLCEARVCLLYAAAIGGMAVLGLLDDVFGQRDTGGFRGHFKKLLLERKLTTGAVKALGGGAVAVALAAAIPGSKAQWPLNAVLIALSANALNLIDLRPGRAFAGFVLGFVAVAAACGFRLSGVWPMAALALPAAAMAWTDMRGRAMMGDTGSNALGGALGLTLALDGGMLAKALAVAFLAALHIFCEKYSLTAIIERSPALRKVDALLGVR